jgi:hypothetical protein
MLRLHGYRDRRTVIQPRSGGVLATGFLAIGTALLSTGCAFGTNHVTLPPTATAASSPTGWHAAGSTPRRGDTAQHGNTTTPGSDNT